MTSTDLPELAPDTLARIEEARKKGHDLVREARAEGEQIWRNAAASAIGYDSHLFSFARSQAESLLARGQANALVLYFNVLTYECFESTPAMSDFEILLKTLDLVARREFPGAPIDLDDQKKAWMSRALGRATLQKTTRDQVNLTFWHDIQMQFQALACPYVYAIPGNGWWQIAGLPSRPFEHGSVKSRLTFAIHREFPASVRDCG